jgi:hypothetical protein
MGMSVGGSNRGIFAEMNVVPLIDVLLVLLVIFMIIPHKQTGLPVELPQPAPPNLRWIRSRRRSSFRYLQTDRCASIRKMCNGTGCAAGWNRSSGPGLVVRLSFVVTALWSFKSLPRL